MNQPTAPAITATIVPASSACTMKGNSVSASRSPTGFQESPASSIAMIVAGVVMGGWLRRADDDETPVGGFQNLDRHAVEAAQGRAGDDLARGSFDAAAGGEIDDPIEVGEDRVDVMGDQQPLLLATRERPDRARGIGARADQLDCLLDPAGGGAPPGADARRQWE